MNPPAKGGELRAARILVIALITGIVIFGGIVTTLTATGMNNDPPLQLYGLNVLAILSCVSAVFFVLAWTMYGKRIRKIKESSLTLPDKLNLYRSALILYMALCEAPALLSSVLLYLTGHYGMMLILLVAAACMMAKFPTTARVVEDANLDWNEQQQLSDQ
jgi:hypothetical protein